MGRRAERRGWVGFGGRGEEDSVRRVSLFGEGDVGVGFEGVDIPELYSQLALVV